MKSVVSALLSMRAWMFVVTMPLWAGEFVSPDGAYRFPVPEGWRARHSPLMTVVEPVDGAPERVLVGSGIAAARTIQELARQAVGISAGMLPGLRVTTGPAFAGASAEQEYANGIYVAWNGMQLQGEVYFAVLAVGRPEKLAELQGRGRTILRNGKFAAPPRNMAAEQQVMGSWELSTYKNTRTGVRDSSSYSSNSTVVFLPGNRFRSNSQSFFSSNSETQGGGSVGAGNEATGSYRIFGGTLVADIDGMGRQLFTIEPVSYTHLTLPTT
jgi:hypothetical protein